MKYNNQNYGTTSKMPKLTKHTWGGGGVGWAGQEVADDNKNNWTLGHHVTRRPPATLNPLSQLCVKKVCFPLHSFLSVRKTTPLFQFKREKTYTGKWNMSWSFWLCNSIVNSESGSNLVIISDHSSDWVGLRLISVQNSITVCYLHLCR